MALKVRQFAGDGTSQDGKTFELVICDPNTNEPLPDVVFICRVITKAVGRQFYAERTTRVPDPRSRQMVELVDTVATADDICKATIVSWTGVVGADDKELVCNDDTKAALDDRIKAQVLTAVLGSEVTGRGPATFRPPA